MQFPNQADAFKTGFGVAQRTGGVQMADRAVHEQCKLGISGVCIGCFERLLGLSFFFLEIWGERCSARRSVFESKFETMLEIA